MGKNNFHGSVPEAFHSMHFLKELILNDNGLTGRVPHSLGGQKIKLEHLSIEENLMTGSVPESICQLTMDGKLSHLSADCSYTTTINKEERVQCNCCTHCY